MKNSSRTQKKQSSRVLFAIAALVISIAVISCNGVGLFDDYVKISTEEDFQKIRADLTGNFALVNDITLTENFEPIGDSNTRFTGTFEGNSKTIRDLKIIKPGENSIGFFGAIGTGGEVRNLRLILADEGAGNPSIEGASRVGALVGNNQGGSISNVGVEGGYVKGEDNVGGLAGDLSDGSITASYATATIEGTDRTVGGLVGLFNTGVVRDSYATGTVSGTTNVGGLIGYSQYDFNQQRSIKNTYATGAVSEATPVGGLIGEIYILTNPSADRIIANYFDAQSTNPNGPELQAFNLANTQGGLTLPVVTAFHTHTDGQVYTEASGGGRVIQQSDFLGWDFTNDSTDGNEDIWHWSGDGIWPRLAWQQ